MPSEPWGVALTCRSKSKAEPDDDDGDEDMTKAEVKKDEESDSDKEPVIDEQADLRDVKYNLETLGCHMFLTIMF